MTNTSLIEQTKKIAIEKVKKILNKNNYPTDFNLDLWSTVYDNTNCYAYAIDSYIADTLKYPNSIYYPGSFSGAPFCHEYTKETILEGFDLDMKSLGFVYFKSSLSEPLEEGEFKVLISVNNKSGDFHFMRQDLDGFWSHKRGWNGLPMNLSKAGEKILNPEHELGNYIKIGYFKIKKIER